MRTTWHGLTVDEGLRSFLAVGRYSDQAGVVDASALEDYMTHYRQRSGRLAVVRHGVEQALVERGNRSGAETSALYRVGRSIYRKATRRRTA